MLRFNALQCEWVSTRVKRFVCLARVWIRPVHKVCKWPLHLNPIMVCVSQCKFSPSFPGSLHLPACLYIIVAFIFTLCLDIDVIVLVKMPRSSSVNAARCVAEQDTACEINCEWYYYYFSSTCSLFARCNSTLNLQYRWICEESCKFAANEQSKGHWKQTLGQHEIEMDPFYFLVCCGRFMCSISHYF